MKLWRVGNYGYVPEYNTHQSFSLQRTASKSHTKETSLSANVLKERFGVGVTVGVMQLRWKGELCLSLRRDFERCDLTIEHDRVLLFSRQTKGRLPVRIQFGLRR